MKLNQTLLARFWRQHEAGEPKLFGQVTCQMQNQGQSLCTQPNTVFLSPQQDIEGTIHSHSSFMNLETTTNTMVSSSHPYIKNSPGKLPKSQQQQQQKEEDYLVVEEEQEESSFSFDNDDDDHLDEHHHGSAAGGVLLQDTSLINLFHSLSVRSLGDVSIVSDNAHLPSNELLTRCSLEHKRKSSMDMMNGGGGSEHGCGGRSSGGGKALRIVSAALDNSKDTINCMTSLDLPIYKNFDKRWGETTTTNNNNTNSFTKVKRRSWGDHVDDDDTTSKDGVDDVKKAILMRNLTYPSRQPSLRELLVDSNIRREATVDVGLTYPPRRMSTPESLPLTEEYDDDDDDFANDTCDTKQRASSLNEGVVTKNRRRSSSKPNKGTMGLVYPNRYPSIADLWQSDDDEEEDGDDNDADDTPKASAHKASASTTTSTKLPPPVDQVMGSPRSVMDTKLR